MTDSQADRARVLLEAGPSEIKAAAARGDLNVQWYPLAMRCSSRAGRIMHGLIAPPGRGEPSALDWAEAAVMAYERAEDSEDTGLRDSFEEARMGVHTMAICALGADPVRSMLLDPNRLIEWLDSTAVRWFPRADVDKLIDGWRSLTKEQHTQLVLLRLRIDIAAPLFRLGHYDNQPAAQKWFERGEQIKSLSRARVS